MVSQIVRFCMLILIAFRGIAQQTESIADIEKAAQNPLADRIFLGVQSYTNLGLGPYNRVQEIRGSGMPYGENFHQTGQCRLPYRRSFRKKDNHAQG